MTLPHVRAYVVGWNDLRSWDLKSARAAAFRLKHPNFVPLGAFIEEATEMVHPGESPSKEWPVYGVNNRGGVYFSHYQRGETFNSAYKRIKQDWFFHNPTRANVGSLGRVHETLPDAITSPEYQVWRIVDGLSPEFVEILIRLPFFLELIDCHRVGAVKERLFVENLRQIPIPVLDEGEQQDIVDSWRLAARRVLEYRAAERDAATALEAEFLTDLGLKSYTSSSRPKAFAVRWEDLAGSPRTTFLSRANRALTLGRHPVLDGKDCFLEVRHGSSASPSSTPTQLEVLKISAVTRGELIPTEKKYAVDDRYVRREFELRAGDVLLCRTNGTLQYVGMSAFVDRDMPNLIFPDKLIRLRVRDIIRPKYLWRVLQSHPLRAQIEASARTAVGNYAIGTEDLWKLKIPVPPVDVQEQIIQHAEEKLKRIRERRDAANAVESQIVRQVEALMLGSRSESRP